ncbi:unnamed protein product [Anisakis simplex]|uniref:Uncharacterized protein n=1 Tax=Anisakis simplex TaxID=6269 RepID=A0A3P6PFN5_ANISI|nr:unnamed protein product [Anisakis simplex]
MLGLLDLGGELMRYAINKVASDNRAPNDVAEFMRMLYAQYLFVGTLRDNNNNKDFQDKLRVLRTSLMKVGSYSCELI